ncbi:MAG: ribbon-helix-helix domain-containing protein [Sulfolobales archaeon]|nr:ribbon-helix-helix domain-containing protein [Sulfolobales archaeon]
MIKPTQMRHSKIITFRVPKELDDTLSEICTKLGYRSKSEFVREAVDDYINYLLSLMLDDEEGDVMSVEDLIEPTRVIMI